MQSPPAEIAGRSQARDRENYKKLLQTQKQLNKSYLPTYGDGTDSVF
jgi:hypothetical protein